MASKRFNKLPKNTSELTAGLIEKLLPELPLSSLIPAVVENPLPRISKLVLVTP